ncbi:MAG: hypothetical protein QOD75_3954 [Blastocatellia bacterium]|nr:hypothetical protein [Blastocatellia bacterium]
MLNQLLRAILVLGAVVLPVWFVIRIAAHILKKRGTARTTIRSEIIYTSLVVYLTMVAGITVVPIPMTNSRNPTSDYVNLVPGVNSFQCLSTAAAGKPTRMTFCLENIVGNLVLMLPLGFLLPLASHWLRSLKRILVIALCFSLSIEIIQFLSRFFGSYRTVDADDVLLNVLGAGLGFGIWYLSVRSLHLRLA